jgi:hypothetical protein
MKMRKRVRTPQEKKRLSLTHDRRNTYGNSTKAARKTIPFKKRRAARAERHHSNAAITSEVRTTDPELVVGLPGRLRGAKHRHWPMSTLGIKLEVGLSMTATVFSLSG